MTAPLATNPQLTTRKRGLWMVGVALLLLLLALLLLAGFTPAVGARYPLAVRLAVYALTATGWFALLVGLFRAIVGPGTGALAAPLRAIAIVVTVGGVAVGCVGAWVVHAVVEEPRSASDGHHHHDWD